MLSSISSRERRETQRGQALVITALMLIVIVGAAAIAVDLSSQGKAHRVLLNWTDSAAIAGVRDCSTTCDAKAEVEDAIKVVYQNSPWSSVVGWDTSAPTAGCTSTGGLDGHGSCVVSNYPGPPGFASYSVSVSAPPANPYNSSYHNSTNYVEVDITQTQNTALAGLIGSASATKSLGHSVAYDAGPPSPFGFTFFSKVETDSGNQVETMQGDVFLGDGYKDQSLGQAGLCVQEVPEPSAATDSDGDGGGAIDNDLDNQGHVVFGVLPPPTVGPEPIYNVPPALCPTSNGGGLLYDQQVSPSAGANCPPPSTPKQDPNNGTWVCYMPAQASPDVPSPTPTPGAPFSQFCGTIDTNSLPGVYTIAANCAQLKLDFNGPSNKGANINCVSLVFPKNTTTQVVWDNKKFSQYITSYGYSHTDTTANNAITKTGGTPPAQDCGGVAATNDRSVVWAEDPGRLISSPTFLSNNQTGCCSDTLMVGTIFVPNRSIQFTTNQAMEDVGAIYCGDWQGQAGNHPNPTVTYDTASTAPQRSALRIVE